MLLLPLGEKMCSRAPTRIVVHLALYTPPKKNALYSPAHELTCGSWPFNVRERCSGCGLNIPADHEGLSGMVLLTAWEHLFKDPNIVFLV